MTLIYNYILIYLLMIDELVLKRGEREGEQEEEEEEEEEEKKGSSKQKQ